MGSATVGAADESTPKATTNEAAALDFMMK
jgi:hypothetical protein